MIYLPCLVLPRLILKEKSNSEEYERYFYRPQTKLRKGYVFTPVRHSVHGGCLPPREADTPPQQTATAADGT